MVNVFSKLVLLFSALSSNIKTHITSIYYYVSIFFTTQAGITHRAVEYKYIHWLKKTPSP